ncbi:MAG: hypothetical protein A2277_19460 [Desulfobacterales bacterium RIFOXYA12_FULL_46_15]|nr:MAG: hypothetical protein A2277_19460 [Desulfobacterales bacterium RIFOXYA12_FULL_46_15]
MFNEKYESEVSGRLSGPYTPEFDTSINEVILFIEKNLIIFSESIAVSQIQNEKGLTQTLVEILNLNARRGFSPFWFEKEYMENPDRGDSPSVDIGTLKIDDSGNVINSVVLGNKSFFSMEAKRLPTPGSNREKEYVIGSKNNGGIERFKTGKHGSALKHSGMIGFIQKNDFKYWNKKINDWVVELAQANTKSDINWYESEILIPKHFKTTTAQLISKHERMNKSYITLCHLWVCL